MIIEAYHGWAGGTFIWNALRAAFPGDWALYDQGYFGNTGASFTRPPDLVLLHSMGVFFVDWNRIPPNVPVVWFNGFDTFCGKEAGYQRSMLKQLNRMQDGLEQNPYAVLRAFYADHWELVKDSIHNLNVPKLRSGLERLKAPKDASLLTGKRPLLAIFSVNDTIAASASRKTLETQANSVIFEPSPDHFLPLTGAGNASQHIQQWLSSLEF